MWKPLDLKALFGRITHQRQTANTCDRLQPTSRGGAQEHNFSYAEYLTPNLFLHNSLLVPPGLHLMELDSDRTYCSSVFVFELSFPYILFLIVFDHRTTLKYFIYRITFSSFVDAQSVSNVLFRLHNGKSPDVVGSTAEHQLNSYLSLSVIVLGKL